MGNDVSDATGSSMEKPTVEKVQEQGGVFCDSVTTQSTFAAFKTHSGYTFTIPTSGNILMWHCFHGLSMYWNMLDITYVLQ